MKKILVVIVIGLSLVACNKPLFSPLPKVETLPVDIVNVIQVTFNGNVIDEGSSAVTTRGFCWALKSNPSVNDNFSQNEFGPGKFSEGFQVIPDSTYYVKAYATNSQGTTYGKETSVSTLAHLPAFTDSRDSTTYRWVIIGTQKWMFDNLAFLPSISEFRSSSREDPKYYVSDYFGTSISSAKATDNYNTYGVLYNWEAAKTACPDGWHLPSDEEWKTLEKHLGMSSTEVENVYWRNSGDVGNKLKSIYGWFKEDNGTNSSGFNALPGGSSSYIGSFPLGHYACFWTSSPGESKSACLRMLERNDVGVWRHSNYPVSYGFSVRCLQN